MVRKMREGMSASGHAPEGIKGAVNRTVTIGSPMDVKLPAVQAQMKHVEDDYGIPIPLDAEGAEYMVMLSSMEIMNFPEYLAAVAKIMHQAGKSWTLCSTAFEATNAGIQIGNSDLARVIVSRIVEGAEKLKVKTVISPECGHAYTALRWEGANLIGRPFTFEVQHIIEVLGEFQAQGLLKTEGFETDRLTFHDPCQMVRRGGVIQQPRTLMNQVAKNFVEMPDAGLHELVLRRRWRRVGHRGRRGTAAGSLQEEEIPARGGQAGPSGHRLRQLPHRAGRRSRALPDGHPGGRPDRTDRRAYP